MCERERERERETERERQRQRGRSPLIAVVPAKGTLICASARRLGGGGREDLDKNV